MLPTYNQTQTKERNQLIVRRGFHPTRPNLKYLVYVIKPQSTPTVKSKHNEGQDN